ncbi:hypothetical protein NQ318_021814 [Aromia moschata]|uniref:Uncharacterized protein n=1 Tax=Aromia moschata TaxID=1265417 RepID=A0AAV8Z7W9_9CUCU|nr:hypothetical protein NQ318_021814 [Aromia moschata]
MLSISGLEVYQDRIFITNPKWTVGIPASLAVIPRNSIDKSPPLAPYPSWEWHKTGNCDGITSVFRIHADSCGRLWVLDSGLVDVESKLGKPRQVCSPQILIFDLRTDNLLTRYVFPADFIKEDGLFANIHVDVRDDCNDVYAYATDIWRYNLVVFSLKQMRAWLVSHHFFLPDPLAASYKLHDLGFYWMDGLIGMALSPYNDYDQDRVLYFNPMTSFREFYVRTSVIRNETGWMDRKADFKILGQGRGPSGQVASSWMDRNGILFYNLVTRDAVGCWDSRKPYKMENLGVVAKSSKTLVFPNDLKTDQEPRQSIWVLSNFLPYYIYATLNEQQVNFRILRAYTDEAVKNTICDPHISTYNTYEPYSDESGCY